MTCIGGLLDTMTGSVILTASEVKEVESYVDQLNAKNAKLHELVRDMWCCISHIGEYDVFYYDMAEDGCGMDCTVNGEHCCADKLHDRMRELGVDG